VGVWWRGGWRCWLALCARPGLVLRRATHTLRSHTPRHRGEGGQAHVAAYDLLIAADAGSNAQLVTSSLQELQKRQAAHTHPPAATTSSSSSAVSQAGVEAEWMAWHDMPHEPCLAHLLPRGAVGVNASSASKVSRCGGLVAWR
jgi:hypothetical protein